MAVEAKDRMVQKTFNINSKETQVLGRLSRVIEELRNLDENIQAPAIMTLLLVAKDPGVNMKTLQTALGVARSTMSRNVALLSSYSGRGGHGLLWSEEDPEDRKSKKVYLTPKGERFVHTITALLAHPEREA